MSFQPLRFPVHFLLVSLMALAALAWQLPAARLLPHLPLPAALSTDLTWGSWHAGRALLRWQQEPAGQLKWTLHPALLLLGQAKTSLHWQGRNSSLEGALHYAPIRSTLHFEDMKGTLDLAALHTLMPPLLAQLQPRGRILLNDLQGSLALTSSRPQLHELVGDMRWEAGQLTGLALKLPVQIRWRTESSDKGNSIIGTLSGQNEQGRLTGEVRILPDQRLQYQLHFSSRASDVPQWVKLVMRRQSENEWSIQGDLSP